MFNLDEVTPLGWPTGGYPKPQGKYAYVLYDVCVCDCGSVYEEERVDVLVVCVSSVWVLVSGCTS